jgi:hypothetical protein
VALHPACRAHFEAERHGDFQAWLEEPAFEALLKGEDA